eukprot:gene10766-11734_t
MSSQNIKLKKTNKFTVLGNPTEVQVVAEPSAEVEQKPSIPARKTLSQQSEIKDTRLNKLTAFLLGTIDENSPLRILHGQSENGPHGSLERMRGLLGGPTKRLGAGELVWLSDRTPHESLPMEDTSIRRQFFRLVVGEIGFWYADHNTANPTGFEVPMNIPIIRGNKFDLVKKIIPVVWESGNKQEIENAKQARKFRKLLYGQGIGFLADELLRNGIYNKIRLRHTIIKSKGDVITQILKSLDRRLFSDFSIRFIKYGLNRVAFSIKYNL